MCGNHVSIRSLLVCSTGSPPRVREPLERRYDMATGSMDHPRVCGNHSITTTQRHRDRGSPPRVREPLFVELPDPAKRRITPACAGTTDKRSHKIGILKPATVQKHSLSSRAEKSAAHPAKLYAVLYPQYHMISRWFPIDNFPETAVLALQS